MGAEETNEEQSWEDIERAAQELFQEKLSFSNAIEIERAHGVNKKNKRRHLAQASIPEDRQLPGTIVARILSLKTNKCILKEARSKRPKRVLFLNEFLWRMLDRPTEQIPQML